LNTPKRVSKTKLGKEFIKKLFLFFYSSLFKEKTCKNRIFVSKTNSRRNISYMGGRCPQDLATKKNKNEHKEKIKMKQKKLRDKKKCTLLAKPNERTW
jgi:hypothetical protein